MNRDMVNDTIFKVAIAPQVIGSNTTIASAYFDTTGYLEAGFIYVTGARTDGTFTPSILEQEDVETAVAITTESRLVKDNHALTTGAIAQATLNTANTVKQIGVLSSKKKIATTITSTGVTTGATVGVLFWGKVAINPADKSKY